MKKAKIKKTFSVVQWFDEDYPYYEEDAERGAFQIGDEVLVLLEAHPNPMGKLYVIFNERTNNATVVSESFIEFI